MAKVREKIIYSDKTRKNTLIAIEDGEEYFFGIARCNTKYDIPSKRRGKEIARARAELSLNNPLHAGLRLEEGCKIAVHSSGLRGFCEKNQLFNVIEYFKNIKSRMLIGDCSIMPS